MEINFKSMENQEFKPEMPGNASVEYITAGYFVLVDRNFLTLNSNTKNHYFYLQERKKLSTKITFSIVRFSDSFPKVFSIFISSFKLRVSSPFLDIYSQLYLRVAFSYCKQETNNQKLNLRFFGKKEVFQAKLLAVLRSLIFG